jgi:hypothetical protein
VGVFISLYPKTYTNNERIFASAAFLPKGTATAGAIVYIQMMLLNLDPIIVDIVNTQVFPTIIVMATMAILITIPLSVPIINKLGPILLIAPEGGVPKEVSKTSTKDGKKVVAKKVSTKTKSTTAKKTTSSKKKISKPAARK